MAGGGVITESGAAAGWIQYVDPNRKWNNNRRLIALHWWIFLLLITATTSGFDNSLMNSFQSLDNWENYFGNPQGGKLGLLNAIQNIGSLAAYPFAPYLSDGLGRKLTILTGVVIMIIAVALQSAAQSLGMFIGSRFLIGFGLTFASNAAPMLVTEVAYPSYRGPLTAAYNSLWYSGNIIASWASYGTSHINSTWSWRIPSILQGAPSAIQLLFIFWIPESPRWLISKGRDAEGLRVLAYYHADGNDEDPLVQYEYDEIKTALELDRESSRNVGWKSLLSTPGNRKRMTIIVAIAWFSQWSGNGLVSYYLNKVFDSIGITNTTIQLMITGILAIWNLFWALLASSLVNRVSRRFLFITSCAGMLLFFTIQTICSARFAITGSNAAANSVIAFIFLFYAAYDIAFTPLIVAYTIEILPYSIRAKGFNVFNFVVSLAVIFNQYVNPIALKNIAWKYYIVYCVWLVFELVFCYFMIVETMGRTLEETAALFDGEDIANAVVGASEVRNDEKVDDEKPSVPPIPAHDKV